MVLQPSRLSLGGLLLIGLSFLLVLSGGVKLLGSVGGASSDPSQTAVILAGDSSGALALIVGGGVFFVLGLLLAVTGWWKGRQESRALPSKEN